MPDTPINIPNPFSRVPIGKTADGKDVFLNNVWYQAYFDAVVRRLGGAGNYAISDIADLDTTDGNIIVGDGTNFVAESGATARASLGLTIGTDVQAWDAQLDDIAALAVTDGNIIVGNGTDWVAESGATARTSLGLGTGDSPQFTGLTLSGQLTSTVATGTAPLVIASTTLVTNLNADLLDGTEAAAFLLIANIDDTPVNGELSAPISSNWAFDHEAAADPHPGYLTPTEGDAAYAPIAEGVTNGDSHDHSGGDGAQIDHGGLAGNSDDDHTHYWTSARGAARVSLRI